METKIFICDLDHSNTNEEEAVFKKAGFDYKWLHCHTQEEVIQSCKGAVVLLNQYVRMDKVIFEALPTVKCIVRYGVGYDNVNLEDARKYNVRVCNIPDYGTREVADHALALMLALTRKIVQTDALVKSGVWDYRREIPLFRMSDATVGICGLGRIGSAFAQRVHALGCRVIGYDTQAQNPNRRFPEFVNFVPFETLLKESDVISLHCPLTEQTYHLFGEKEFDKMKKTSCIINDARGGIIDESALLNALTSGSISAAAIDVAEKEPLTAENPLLKLQNFIATPHTAWYSEQSSSELKRKAAEEAVRFMTGEPVHYRVL